MSKIALVYPYKAIEYDEELLLSLRSVEENLEGDFELIIVGDRPTELKEDSYHFIEGNKLSSSFANVAVNSLEGVKWALKQGMKKAIVMNDDFIVLQPTVAKSIPLYSRFETVVDFEEKLRQWRQTGTLWHKTISDTTKWVKAFGANPDATKSFEVHAPLAVDSKLFIEALESVDFEAPAYPQWRTVYGVYAASKRKKLIVEEIIDPKTRKDGGWREENPRYISFHQIEQSSAFRSPTARSAVPPVRRMFPKASKWEKIRKLQKVAVAISSDGNRIAALQRTIEAFLNYRPDFLTVNFDFERRGVAWAKNEGIEWFLKETDADALFLVDDDFRPKNDEYKAAYLRKAEDEGIPHFTGVYRNDKKIASERGLTFGSHPSGPVLFLTREAVERVGYMREKEFVFGWEHVEYSKRIANAFSEVYSEASYIDIENSIKLWTGDDFDIRGQIKPMVERYKHTTVKKNERRFEEHEAVFRKYEHSDEKVER